MNDVTEILGRIENDDPSATEELLPVVYKELRRLADNLMAREKPGQTLQATALVHEAYLRLVGGSSPLKWDSQRHFFAAAAEAMRRILLNRARDRNRLKRGGDRQQVDLDQIELALDTPEDRLLELDEAIEMLCKEDAVCGNLVKLRFFAGLTLQQAAESLDLAPRTADRHWAYARAWLFDFLTRDEN